MKKSIHLMTKYIFALLISFVTTLSFGQDKITITGKVTDGLHYPLTDAEIILGNQSDSTKIVSATTNESGVFKLELTPQEKPVYLIIDDALEGVFKQSFESLKNNIDLGTVIINPMIYDLDEVIVTNVEPIVVKQDTIEYNADSYKVKPNANLETLLNELPGFEMDEDGKITVNGKNVNEILIDGEPFFGTDGKVALENLPADIIKKIQVSDYKTKNEKFSGERSKSDKSSLNITLKEDKKKGYMLKATAGYGTANHYEGNLMANYFKGKKKISLIGSSTDIASSGMTNGEGSRGQGRMGRRNSNGVTNNTSIGLNYSDQLNDNLKIGADYRLNHSYTKNDQFKHIENFAPKNTYISDANSKTKNETYGHNFGTNLEWTKNNTKIYFYPSFNNSSSTKSSISDSKTYSDLGDLRNQMNQTSDAKSNSNTFKTVLSLNQQFKNKSYLDFNSDISIGKTDRNSFINSTTLYTTDSIDDIYRNVNEQNISKDNSYNFNVKYTYPISDSLKIAVGTAYNLTDSETNNRTLNYNETTGEYDNLNTDLTRFYSTRLNELNPFTQLLLNKKKISATLRLGATIYNQQNFGIFKAADYRSTQNKTLPDISGNIRYQNGNNSLSLLYNYQTSLASTSQVLPIIDETDPLDVFKGNPDLNPNKAHRINLMFSNFDRKTRQGFNANLGYTYNESNIVNYTEMDYSIYKRTTTYENVKGNYRLNGNVFFNKHYQKGNNKFRINIGTSASYALTQGFRDAVKYEQYNTTLSPMLRLNWDYGDYLTISPSYRLNFTNSKYVNYSIDNQNNITHNFGIKTISTFPKNLTWTNDFSYNYNSRMVAGFKRDFFLWNTSLMYRFFDDKLEAGIKVYDLLNQNNSYTRTINAESVVDQRNNILTQFIMFSLTFNLNQFGAKVSKTGDGNRYRESSGMQIQ
ncbi:outer membrane beta-barrel protein [Empedobacter falsenii]|uniref:Outer membrane beta-barrel protein n=1 Tax=Empedobacter falsenii TaxID=343874 RepID=A0ABY8V697_9FLAO|nr:outer membrane beta-barrel protein [Empedobacter falsenii]WIH96446.1 outer membrane beta-barrel protein [Empedobacter falsenii]